MSAIVAAEQRRDEIRHDRRVVEKANGETHSLEQLLGFVELFFFLFFISSFTFVSNEGIILSRQNLLTRTESNSSII